MLKLKTDALRDDAFYAGRRQFYQSRCRSVREATTASGVDNRLPPGQTPLNGIISPSERLITMQKQLEGLEVY